MYSVEFSASQQEKTRLYVHSERLKCQQNSAPLLYLSTTTVNTFNIQLGGIQCHVHTCICEYVCVHTYLHITNFHDCHLLRNLNVTATTSCTLYTTINFMQIYSGTTFLQEFCYIMYSPTLHRNCDTTGTTHNLRTHSANKSALLCPAEHVVMTFLL